MMTRNTSMKMGSISERLLGHWAVWQAVRSRALIMAALCAAVSLGSNYAEAALPSIPINSKVGSVEIPLNCDFPIVGTQIVNLQLTGTVQNTLAPGQTFYLGDATGTMVIPKSVVNVSVLFLRAATASGTVDDLEILGVDASPASLNAFSTPATFGPVALVKGQTATVSLPSSGFLQIGPFVAGSAGTAQLQLGAAHTLITLGNAKGKDIGKKPLNVQCSAPNPAVNIVSMTVAGSSTTAVAQPHSGLDSSGFSPPLNNQIGILRYTAMCTIAGLIHQSVDVTITGTLGTNFTPGQSFYINNASGQLHLSADSVNLLLTLMPFTTTLSGILSELDIRASNTTQGTVNAAMYSAIQMSSVGIARNQDATLTIPETGTLNIGPFTTNGTGQLTDVTIGATAGVLTTLVTGGAPGIPLAVSCAAPVPAVNLVSVTIASGN